MTLPNARRAFLAALALASLAACTGRNDGNRDPYGGSSDGEGGSPPPGPRAGQSTDTTTAPTGTVAGAPAGTDTAASRAAAPDSAKGAQ